MSERNWNDFDGKVLMVYGASGSLGAAILEQLGPLAKWFRVIAASRNGPDPANFSDDVDCLSFDPSDASSVANLKPRLQGQELGVLVNAAGMLHGKADSDLMPERKLSECSESTFQALFASNSVQPALLVQSVAEFLPRKDVALIVSLSARVGSIGDNRMGGWYAYRASKAALNMLNRCWSIELGRRHKGLISVCWHPGTVDSALSEPFQRNVPADKLFSPKQSAGYLKQCLEQLTRDDNGGFMAWDGKPIPW